MTRGYLSLSLYECKLAHTREEIYIVFDIELLHYIHII